MQENGTATSVSAYGVDVLLGNHPAVRRLIRKHRPVEHGHKIWTSSWVLIDYLQSAHILSGARVLDLGCGWGVARIYCLKIHGAEVVWADIDAAVEPYLGLMARTNRVDATFANLGIDQVGTDMLKRVDVVIASDICFCDTMIDPLTRLARRAEAAGRVRHLLIADPGRWPFDDLADVMMEDRRATLLERRICEPRPSEGKILHINFASE